MSTLTVAPVCVIEAVAAPEKEKTKLGETSMAGWLQSEYAGLHFYTPLGFRDIIVLTMNSTV